MRPDIVSAFHRTSGLHREDIFESGELMPITAFEDANTPAPGWVGQSWSEGTLLVGINPGGGGDNYRRNIADDELYLALREFREAGSPRDQSEALRRMSESWMRIQQGHNIWRIIRPILEATGEGVDEIAFMNILPFRTRMDKPAPAAAMRNAWNKAARPQIAALRPRRIIALGKKAWDILSRHQLPASSELILFKRGIGDSYIPVESQAVLRELTRRRKATSPRR